jgi:hypothetical protein
MESIKNHMASMFREKQMSKNKPEPLSEQHHTSLEEEDVRLKPTARQKRRKISFSISTFKANTNIAWFTLIHN